MEWARSRMDRRPDGQGKSVGYGGVKRRNDQGVNVAGMPFADYAEGVFIATQLNSTQLRSKARL